MSGLGRTQVNGAHTSRNAIRSTQVSSSGRIHRGRSNNDRPASALTRVTDGELKGGAEDDVTTGPTSGGSGRLTFFTDASYLMLRNLYMLKMHTLSDWPGITAYTFSQCGQIRRKKPTVAGGTSQVNNGGNASGRSGSALAIRASGNLSCIKSAEWLLYRLFELHDPVETKATLAPLFPPSLPLQSVSLRSAYYRLLEEMKRNQLIRREVLLRRSILDECRGPRFINIILDFSTLLVKKFCVQEWQHAFLYYHTYNVAVPVEEGDEDYEDYVEKNEVDYEQARVGMFRVKDIPGIEGITRDGRILEEPKTKSRALTRIVTVTDEYASEGSPASRIAWVEQPLNEHQQSLLVPLIIAHRRIIDRIINLRQQQRRVFYDFWAGIDTELEMVTRRVERISAKMNEARHADAAVIAAKLERAKIKGRGRRSYRGDESEDELEGPMDPSECADLALTLRNLWTGSPLWLYAIVNGNLRTSQDEMYYRNWEEFWRELKEGKAPGTDAKIGSAKYDDGEENQTTTRTVVTSRTITTGTSTVVTQAAHTTLNGQEVSTPRRRQHGIPAFKEGCGPPISVDPAGSVEALETRVSERKIQSARYSKLLGATQEAMEEVMKKGKLVVENVDRDVAKYIEGKFPKTMYPSQQKMIHVNI